AAHAMAVATDPSGNVAVAGSFEGTVDFGTGPMTSSGFKDGVVAKCSAAGVPLWAKSYGERNDDEEALGVAMDGSGNVVVTGYFKQTVDFGTGPLTAAGGYLGDVFVAKYSASGASLWVKQIGSSGFDKGTAVAVDGANNVLVTGFFNGTVDFGLGTVTGGVDFGGGLLPDLGGGDMFVAKYSPRGAHLWSKRFGGAGRLGEQAEAVAADGAGNVIVTGAILDSVSFGGPVLWSNQTYDIF